MCHTGQEGAGLYPVDRIPPAWKGRWCRCSGRLGTEDGWGAVTEWLCVGRGYGKKEKLDQKLWGWRVEEAMH